MIEEDERPDHPPLGGGEDTPDVKPAKAAAALLDHRFNHARSPSGFLRRGLGRPFALKYPSPCRRRENEAAGTRGGLARQTPLQHLAGKIAGGLAVLEGDRAIDDRGAIPSAFCTSRRAPPGKSCSTVGKRGLIRSSSNTTRSAA